MRHLFATIFGLWFLATGAFAQDAGAIEDVISGQLQAFSDRDMEGAWAYASPNIQGLFGNPARFGTMVQQGYPMVWDNADVQFLELRERGASLWQMIKIRDVDGGLHWLDYQMVQTDSGWQINGVQLLPPPDVGA